MLNVNVISTPVKSWRYSECIEKADPKEKKEKEKADPTYMLPTKKALQTA